MQWSVQKLLFNKHNNNKKKRIKEKEARHRDRQRTQREKRNAKKYAIFYLNKHTALAFIYNGFIRTQSLSRTHSQIVLNNFRSWVNA